MVLANHARNIGGAVEPSKQGHDAGDPAIHVVALRHVHFVKGKSLRTKLLVLRLEVQLGVFYGLQVDVGDADNGASLGEHFGRGKADAAGAACNREDFVTHGHFLGVLVFNVARDV